MPSMIDNIRINKKLITSVYSTSVYSIIGKIGGLSLPFLLANMFGINAETDAFYFSYGVILYLATIVSPALEKIIVPYIAEKRNDRKNTNEMINNIIWISIIFIIILLIIVLVAMRLLIVHVLTRFSQENINLSMNILLIVSPMAVMLVGSSIISGTLNAYKYFKYPAISPLVRFMVILVMIFILKRYLGIYSVAVGYSIGEIFRLLFLLYIANKKEVLTIKVGINYDKTLLPFFRSSIHQIVASMFFGFTVIIDRIFAGTLDVGSLTLFHYAERIYFIPYTFITVGLIPVLLTHWGDKYNINYNRNSRMLVTSVDRLLKKGLLPITIFILLTVIISKYITPILLFNKTNITDDQITIIFYLFCILMIGLLPAIYGSLVTNGLIIIDKTKYILYLAFLVFIIKPIITYIMINILQLIGIAVSNVILHVLFFCSSYYLLIKTKAIPSANQDLT